MARLIVLTLTLLATVVLTACAGGTDDLEPRVAGSEQQVQQLQEQLEQLEVSVEKGRLLGALTALNETGFHALDDQMTVATEIPGGVSGRVKKARQAAESITWPHDLEGHGNKIVAKLKDFEGALSANNLAACKQLAAEVHDIWHDMEGPAYAFLVGERAASH
jgi:hypothetical protein